MKAISITTAFLAVMFFVVVAVNFVGADAEAGPGNPDCPNFVDTDGDGINDNCTGDGTRPQDGTGQKRGVRRGGGSGDGTCPNFVDEDGDGINDNCPNKGVRPQDGTGLRKRAKRGTRGGNCGGAGCKSRRGGRS